MLGRELIQQILDQDLANEEITVQDPETVDTSDESPVCYVINTLVARKNDSDDMEGVLLVAVE